MWVRLVEFLECTSEDYLHLGWTCLTAVLTDCVHWPPGLSHMGLDSKLSLQVTQLLSSHRLSQDAKHVCAHTNTHTSSERNIDDKWNIPNKKIQRELKVMQHTVYKKGQPWRVHWECRGPWCSQVPRWAACLWGRDQVEGTACSECNPAHLTAGCYSGWPGWQGAASAEMRSLR